MDKNDEGLPKLHKVQTYRTCVTQTSDQTTKCGTCKRVFCESQEFVLSVILTIAPLFSISYTNLINLLCGITMMIFLLNVTRFWIFQIKWILLSWLLAINIVENAFRIIYMGLLYYSIIPNTQFSTWRIFGEYFLLEPDDISYTIYNFIVSSVITIGLFVYYLCKKLTTSSYYTEEYIYNIKTLKRMHSIKYFLLFFSLFLISVSAGFHPNLVSFGYAVGVITIIILWAVRWHMILKKVYKLFSFCLCAGISAYLVVIYLFNCKDLFYQLKDERLLANLIGIIYLHDTTTEFMNKSYHFIVSNIISVILMVNVLMLINIYMKCKDYKSKVQNYNIPASILNESICRRKLLSSEDINNATQMDESMIENDINNSNEMYYISSFEENTVILIMDDTEKMGFFDKLTIVIRNYVYSPYFIMHFCRVGLIIWINYFQNYLCIVFIFWLFVSLIMKESGHVYRFTSYAIFPLLIFSFCLTFVSNIQGIDFVDYQSQEMQVMIKELGLTKFPSNYVFIAILIKFLVVYLFGIFIRIQRISNAFAELRGASPSSMRTVSRDIPTGEGSNLDDLKEPLIETNTTIPNPNPQHANTKDMLPHLNKSEYTLKLSEIFLKLVVSHIGKVTLLFMYIASVRSVNVHNLILMIFFLTLLTLPKYTRNKLRYIILFVQYVLFIKYIWIFVSPRVTLSIGWFNFINFIFLDITFEKQNLYVYDEVILWVTLYCLYVEYQNYSSKIYEIYKNKKIDLYEYVDFHLGSYPKWRYIFHCIFDFMLEVYLWMLFLGFFISIILLDTDALLCINLIWVFIVIDQYLKIVETNYTRWGGIFWYLWILILVSGAITVIIYLFQFWSLKIMEELYISMISLFPHWISNNLKKLGFRIYKENLWYYLLPYFASNLFTVLMYYEINRIISNKKKSSTHNTRDSPASNLSRWLYKILFYLLKYYWMGVFLSVFSLAVAWQLSLSMVILLSVFVYHFVMCFYSYFLSFKKNRENMKLLTCLNSMLKYYSDEKAEHYKITNSHRTRSLAWIWVFTISFVISTYAASILIDFKLMQNDHDEEYLKGYIKSIMYLLGFYYSDYDTHKVSFSSTVSGFIFLLVILIVETYFQNKCYEFYIRLKEKDDGQNQEKLLKLKKKLRPTGSVVVLDEQPACESETIHEDKKHVDLLSPINPNQAIRKQSSFNEIKSDFLLNHTEKSKEEFNFYTKTKSQQIDNQAKVKCSIFEEENLANMADDLKYEFQFPNYFNFQRTRSKSSYFIIKAKSLLGIANTTTAGMSNDQEEIKEEVNESNISQNSSDEDSPDDQVKENENNIQEEEEVDVHDEENMIPLYDGSPEMRPKKRGRRNAMYKKQTLVKYSLEVQLGFKRLIEEVILFSILLSAILKINIISFLNIIIVILGYKSVNKLQSMFYLSAVLLFLFCSQYLIFVTNISVNTVITSHTHVLNDLSKYLNIPWSNQFGYKWGLFFSTGVSRYQIDTLWLDFIILNLVYIYLELFSFAIFDIKINSDKTAYMKYDNAYKQLNNFSKEEYESFKKAMKISFDINIQDLERAQESSLVNSQEWNDAIDTYRKKKSKNKYLHLYKRFKRYLYLTFHNIVLVVILMFSSMSQGLVSLPYMLFSIVYIYKTHNFLMGRDWTFEIGVRYFLKPYLFMDIVLRLIFQIPSDLFMQYRLSVKQALDILGFEYMINYNSLQHFLVMSAFFHMLLKLSAYFLISLQEIIYSAPNFKKFILKYHLNMKQKTYVRGKLLSFIFNNSRIRLMNERLEERKNIDITLKKIEIQLIKWNEKLKRHQPGAELKLQIRPTLSEISLQSIQARKRRKLRRIAIFNKSSSSKGISRSPVVNENKQFKKVDDISIRKLLLKHWLIRVSIYLHEESNLLISTKIDNEDHTTRILKGHMSMKSELEKLIDKYEEENENKYSVIQRLRKGILGKGMLEMRESGIKEEDEENDNENENENDENIPNEEKETPTVTDQQLKKPNELLASRHFSLISADSQPTNQSQSSNTEIKIEEKEEFLESTQYYELKSSLRADFFLNYCSKKKILQFIIVNIMRYLIQSFEYICYFFMIVNHMVNCNFLSLLWPMIVFCFGIAQYPRPRKSFWKISIFYCCAVICFKFFLQLSVWIALFSPDAKPLEDGRWEIYDVPRFGVELYQSTLCRGFIRYIIFDFILLSVLLANQFMLIRKGLWDLIEPDLENVEEAYDRINKYNSKRYQQMENGDDEDEQLRRSDLVNREKLEVFGKLLKTEEKITVKQRVIKHYNEIFTRVRNEKPGKDLYVYYTLFLMLIVVFIIFFYTKMDQDKIVYNADNLKLKQFSGNMVMFAFAHVFLLVLDRYIYLKNSRKTKRMTFKVYDIVSGKEVTSEYSFENEEIAKKACDESENLEMVYFQYEGQQYGLIYKYILQIAMVLFCHTFVFWYFPIRGNFNLQGKSTCEQVNHVCNEFPYNTFLIIFYLLYCVYFTFSGLQLKYGMVDLRKQSALMKGSNLFYSVTFKTFKAIPFLYELKLFIDWTFTTTSLDLFKWLKFEAIYDLLFINQCNMKSYRGRKVGTRVTKYEKFFIGGISFLSILIIVFGPLVLFSTINPSNRANAVTGAKLELQLSIKKRGEVASNFTLFRNSLVQEIVPIDKDMWEMNKFDKIAETKNYDREQVKVVKVSYNSETNWDVSAPTYDYIMSSLQMTEGLQMYFNMKYSFDREISGTGDVPATTSYRIQISGQNYVDLKIALTRCYNAVYITQKTSPLIFQDFYNPAIRLTSSSTTVLMTDSAPLKTVNIVYSCNKGKLFWQIFDVTSKEGKEKGIEFYTFADLVSPTTAGYDVLTFYISFILIIGKFIRSMFTGEAERVIYSEMTNPTKLLSLCEGIKISRFKKDLLQEDKLYYVLIDLLRSPEMLKTITKSSLKFTQASEETRVNSNSTSENIGDRKKSILSGT